MKLFRNYSLLLVVLFLVGCSTQGSITQNHSLKKYSFNIIQLNDVYEIAPIQNDKYGGMARVETVHQQILKENPNTLLVLAGDFLNPSLLGTIKVNGDRVRGKQMVEVMNAMDFDLVAFGNHEFDLSYKDLQKRINESNFDWISSNVLHNESGKTSKFFKEHDGIKKELNEYAIRNFTFEDGTELKVGFISVCIASNPKDYVRYGDILENIKRSYTEVKSKVDIVLGLTHVKVEQDREIAKLLPDVPLIMGGHEHTNSYERVGDVTIAKADANAKTVYIHRLEYNKDTKKVYVKSELKGINESIPFDEEVNSIVTKWQDILNKKIKEIIDNPNEIIYLAKVPLDARDTPIRSIQTNMGTLITKAMSYSYQDEVDCALVNGGSIRIDDMLAGEINAVDIFRVLPYGGEVLKVKLTGALLKKVLEYGEQAAGTGAYLQRFNATKVNNVWFVKNQKIQEEKEYMVAFSDYLLKGFDIPFLSPKNTEVLSIYTPKSNETAFDIRKAVIGYLKERKK